MGVKALLFITVLAVAVAAQTLIGPTGPTGPRGPRGHNWSYRSGGRSRSYRTGGASRSPGSPGSHGANSV